ncbi:hypothetical protein SUDANB121_00003 [Nocardiopsis dassonvillei]|uniref:DUF397 domain-containing protein n=1 Tax=Nocardiopsis dassonvillei TaxID=2014 RepID=UPI003F54B893
MTRRLRPEDFEYRKSSYSSANGPECVEVGDLPGVSAVRDTRNRHLGALLFPSNEWNNLLAATKSTED